MLSTVGKRKPSFKMVSNLVINLLHSINYKMEVPFSNMSQQPVEMQKTMQKTKNLNGDIGPVSIENSRRGTSAMKIL